MKHEHHYVPNTSRLSQMILLCPDHVGSHFLWNPNKADISTGQLKLF